MTLNNWRAELKATLILLAEKCRKTVREENRLHQKASPGVGIRRDRAPDYIWFGTLVICVIYFARRVDALIVSYRREEPLENVMSNFFSVVVCIITCYLVYVYCYLVIESIYIRYIQLLELLAIW